MQYAKPKLVLIIPAVEAVKGTTRKDDPVVDFACDDRSTSPAYEAEE